METFLQHLGQAGGAAPGAWVGVPLQPLCVQGSQQTLLEALGPQRAPLSVCEHKVSGDESIKVQPKAFLGLLQEPSDLEGEKTYIQLIFK